MKKTVLIGSAVFLVLCLVLPGCTSLASLKIADCAGIWYPDGTVTFAPALEEQARYAAKHVSQTEYEAYYNELVNEKKNDFITTLNFVTTLNEVDFVDIPDNQGYVLDDGRNPYGLASGKEIKNHLEEKLKTLPLDTTLVVKPYYGSDRVIVARLNIDGTVWCKIASTK